MANTVLTNVRLSYVHILKPYSADPSQEAKYSVTVLVPKSDTANKAKLDAAIAEATQQGATSKWNGVVPPILPNPVHDGDGTKMDGTEYGPECKGHWVFTASSPADRPVEVVDTQLNKILDATEVYSGMYANICVNFYPYLYQGKKGIGCGLGPVQKVKDGESLGGGAPSAASVFSAVKINPLTGQPM